MNILHIIGNGFDLNLGLKTSYRDFYDYYQSIDSKKTHVSKLKHAISNDFENWSDLEWALGQYTKGLTSTIEFEEILMDIGDNLAEYLRAEETKFDFGKVKANKMYEYLSSPEKIMPPASREDILDFKNAWSNNVWNVNIFTFNYTQSLEAILGDNIQNLQIGGQHNTILQSLNHIHGYIDHRMVLGVNDKSQIANSDFQHDEELVEAFIKDEYNKLTKQKINNDFHQKIEEADLICIFGSSFGDTDNIWWNRIAEQLTRDIKIIVFPKSDLVTDRWQHKIGKVERQIRKKLADKSKLNKLEKEDVDSKIIVCINSNMFKF